MNIQINKKKYRIKPSSELTVNEYISFFGQVSENANQMEVVICYISALTGLTYHDITSVSISDNTLRKISAYIGQIQLPGQIPSLEKFYYKKTGKYLYKKNLNWRTLGARKMLEDRQEENQMQLAVYQLAVYLSKYDATKADEIFQELQDYRAIDVLGFIIFFFMKLQNGKKSGQNFFSMLVKIANTSIRKLLPW